MKNNNAPPAPPAKGGRTLFYIFSIVIIALLALLLLAVVVTKQSGKPIMVLGHGMMILNDNTMGDAIPMESVIIIKKVDTDTLSVDDIITFNETTQAGNSTITARIARLDPTADGLHFYTKNDLSNDESLTRKTENDIYGKVINTLPALGRFLMFVKSPIGLTVCIALPLALLLLIEIINLFKVSKVVSREELLASNSSLYAERFGTRIYDFDDGKKKRPKKKKDDEFEPLNVEDIKYNIGNKVKGLKQGGFIKSPIYEAIHQKDLTDTLEFDRIEPPDAPIPFKISTIDEDDDYDDEIEFRSPRNFKIEPLQDEHIRITPHKIITKAEEDAELLSKKIITLHDELLLDEEIIRNMGEFEFERPNELINAIGGVTNRHRFSRNKAKLALRKDVENEFISTVQNGGRDNFNLEGMNVRVKPNALRLNLDSENQDRDVTITVTDEYTSVIVDGSHYQVNFALFKDVQDGQQKVVIQKKNIN